MSILDQFIAEKLFPSEVTTVEMVGIIRTAYPFFDKHLSVRKIGKACAHLGLRSRGKRKGSTVWYMPYHDKPILELKEEIEFLMKTQRLVGYMTSDEVEEVVGVSILLLRQTLKHLGIHNVGIRTALWQFDVTDEPLEPVIAVLQMLGEGEHTTEEITTLHNDYYTNVSVKSMSVSLSRHPRVEKCWRGPRNLTWKLRF